MTAYQLAIMLCTLNLGELNYCRAWTAEMPSRAQCERAAEYLVDPKNWKTLPSVKFTVRASCVAALQLPKDLKQH